MKYLAVLLLGIVIIAGCTEKEVVSGKAADKVPASGNAAEPAKEVSEKAAVQDKQITDRSKTYYFDSGSRPKVRPGRSRQSEEPVIEPQPVASPPYSTPDWIRERQAIEDNPVLRCTDYYEIYKAYFLDVKEELHDFQGRYLRKLKEYFYDKATASEVSKIEWRMKEKEVVYGKVQDAFRRLNEECGRTYEFQAANEVFIETVDLG